MKKLLIFMLMFGLLNSVSLGFSDEEDFYWAKKAIDNWSSKGYISGYPDGTFRGNSYITRAEVISIINKINNSDVAIDKRAGKDIKEDDWFFEDMGVAVETSLISVDSEGNLRPNEYATREEVMVILSKLLNISYSGNLENAKVKNFLDSNEITSSEYKKVAGVVEEGFVNGYKDNTLRPKGNITRAEFMCVLDNAIQEIISYGEYSNKALVGNIVINGKDVKIINSEIQGKVFVLAGARDSSTVLIDTKVSKGINSRVGEILIKDVDKFETVTQHESKEPEDNQELAFVKLSYSETDWTKDDVKVTLKVDDKDYKMINGNDKIVFERNGEKEVEYEYKGNIIRVKAKVENIDKSIPRVTTNVQCGTSSATIAVEVEDDGLSPITNISCSSGVINKLDKETNEIGKVFTVTANGTYTITVEDEAGNERKVDVKVEGIGLKQEGTTSSDLESGDSTSSENNTVENSGENI